MSLSYRAVQSNSSMADRLCSYGELSVGLPAAALHWQRPVHGHDCPWAGQAKPALQPCALLSAWIWVCYHLQVCTHLLHGERHSASGP